MADIRTSGMGGVPKGTTADRPSSPSIGDVFYNGTLGCLEIYTSQGWVANSAPPGIPTIGTATYSATNKAYNNSSASVAFTPGEGGGLPNSYRATSSPGGFTGTSSTSPITVSGLQSTVEYTFSVTGTNNFGTSAGSTNSNSITANTVPQAPTIGTLSYVSSTVLSLTFTAGATGGESITNYKYSEDGINYTAFSPAQTSSPLTISGLTPSTTYSFYLKAVNSNGDSAASSVSNSASTAVSTVTGGTLSSDSTYYYRTFTGNGTLQISNRQLIADVLMVGGGGGTTSGGPYSGGWGGGGGAGGLVYKSSETLGVNSYSLVVGAGGAATTALTANNGVNTTFNSWIAYGGGGGGSYGAAGNNGGSGGGGGGDTFALGGTETQSISATGGFGNSGGNSLDPAPETGGGGGGAGSVGASGGTNTTGGPSGGAGGAGKQYLAFATATSTGRDGGYYAGGGGGGNGTNNGSYTGGLGGAGGGGIGSSGYSSSYYQGDDGYANTGGGAGSGNQGAGNNGGSGIIIVRYLKTAVGG